MKSTDSVIVSWDFSHGKDVGVLIVGKQEKGKVEIINALQVFKFGIALFGMFCAMKSCFPK